jgi:hypothetical protein
MEIWNGYLLVGEHSIRAHLEMYVMCLICLGQQLLYGKFGSPTSYVPIVLYRLRVVLFHLHVVLNTMAQD